MTAARAANEIALTDSGPSGATAESSGGKADLPIARLTPQPAAEATPSSQRGKRPSVGGEVVIAGRMRPMVLDVQLDPDTNSGYRFEDPNWRTYLPALKPVALAMALSRKPNKYPGALCPVDDGPELHAPCVGDLISFPYNSDPESKDCNCRIAKLVGYDDSYIDAFELHKYCLHVFPSKSTLLLQQDPNSPFYPMKLRSHIDDHSDGYMSGPGGKMLTRGSAEVDSIARISMDDSVIVEEEEEMASTRRSSSLGRYPSDPALYKLGNDGVPPVEETVVDPVYAAPPVTPRTPETDLEQTPRIPDDERSPDVSQSPTRSIFAGRHPSEGALASEETSLHDSGASGRKSVKSRPRSESDAAQHPIPSPGTASSPTSPTPARSVPLRSSPSRGIHWSRSRKATPTNASSGDSAHVVNGVLRHGFKRRRWRAPPVDARKQMRSQAPSAPRNEASCHLLMTWFVKDQRAQAAGDDGVEEKFP